MTASGRYPKYHEYNVDVVRKDGLLLVRELAAEVKNHMDFKINAVMKSFQRELSCESRSSDAYIPCYVWTLNGLFL
ncbi:hypothetical protein B5X24_HaOG204731 [Helicoverpa armigera]|uniref:Uncharacterized protein n=1 Tax=Helicoverpa armigera TaxID=29058 RepID=A0A2W1BRU2_HELAM|nr:hypothetical protein B5X24_HaOG204731 [Helicoverpa armigera]